MIGFDKKNFRTINLFNPPWTYILIKSFFLFIPEYFFVQSHFLTSFVKLLFDRYKADMVINHIPPVIKITKSIISKITALASARIGAVTLEVYVGTISSA